MNRGDRGKNMLSIKGWSKFQHFKDRKPPWIKLYRDLMDDVEWFSLPDESAKVLIMLWLIASETNGYLPDIKTVSFRIRRPIAETRQILSTLKHWLIFDEEQEPETAINTDVYQVDIKEISARYQDDSLETETETEKEIDKNLLSEAVRLSDVLADLILKHTPKHRELSSGGRVSATRRWAKDIEKLHRIDGMDWKDIEQVIRWCQGDKFWKANILSGQTLRKQWDKLQAKMRSDIQPSTAVVPQLRGID